MAESVAELINQRSVVGPDRQMGVLEGHEKQQGILGEAYAGAVEMRSTRKNASVQISSAARLWSSRDTLAATRMHRVPLQELSPVSPPPSLADAYYSPTAFTDLKELGRGNGGVVYKSFHKESGMVMARKVLPKRNWAYDLRLHKLVLPELEMMQKCRSQYIVKCYGAFLAPAELSVAMEYMEAGSLDNIYKTIGKIEERVLGQVALSVLHGLVYLHQSHRIIHRDLKPSNILVNAKGQIKLCDFGESVELVNSLASSLVGTIGYMAPERILGASYSIRSDTWSLGISLIELATGRFPFTVYEDACGVDDGVSRANGTNLAIAEILEIILYETPPRLDPTTHSAKLVDFVRICLTKEECMRPSAHDLLQHPFVADAAEHAKNIDLKKWVKDIPKRPSS